MRSRPTELTDADILAELAAGWGVDAASASYLPVGFGSHHWRVRGGDGDWFVTVDDLDARRRSADEGRGSVFDRLRASLRMAQALRDGGLSFVVAPRPTDDGGVMRRLADRFAITLYEYVEGRSRTWSEPQPQGERMAIVALLGAVHRARLPADLAAISDDYSIANRVGLERAIAELDREWEAGPYAEQARALLGARARGVERLLALHDRLAVEARARPERLVPTHGEPHPGNVILTEAGPRLVDWDTALTAPPERDLWIPGEGVAAVVTAYAAATGRQVLPEMLEFYRLTWDLTDIAGFVTGLRQPHEPTADTEKAWAGLVFRLDLARRWPAFA